MVPAKYGMQPIAEHSAAPSECVTAWLHTFSIVIAALHDTSGCQQCCALSTRLKLTSMEQQVIVAV